MSLWNSAFDVLAPTGEPVVRLDVGAMRERTEFALGAAEYHVRPADDGALLLLNTATGLPEAQLVTLRGLSHDADVEARLPLGDVFVRIARGSVFERAFRFRTGGVQVGELRREGVLQTRTWMDVPEAWPLSLQAFMAWWCLRRLAAEDAAAAS